MTAKGSVFYRTLDWLVNTTPDFPHALCRNEEPDLFFPNPTDEIAAALAKSICRPCVHRTACVQYAIDADINDGIFGGLDARQRDILRRRGGAA